MLGLRLGLSFRGFDCFRVKLKAPNKKKKRTKLNNETCTNKQANFLSNRVKIRVTVRVKVRYIY